MCIRDSISVCDGKVYFCRSATGSAKGSLLCYDPATGITVTVYDGYIIESYCFYDGKLYALAFTKYADKPDGYTYVFGQIINGAFSAISSELKYSQEMCIRDSYRPLALLLPDDGGKGHDRRRYFGAHGLPTDHFVHVDHRRYFARNEQKNTAEPFLIQPYY